MSEQTTLEKCQELARAIDYEAGGIPSVAFAMAELHRALANADMTTNAGLVAIQQHREKLLQEGAFPGCQSREESVAPLVGGQAVSGKLEGYKGASLTFWTVDSGRVAVPFELIEREMQECWPQDAMVKLRKQIEILVGLIFEVEGQLEGNEATGAEMRERVIAVLDRQEERLTELEIVNAALRAEIDGHIELHRQRDCK